MLAYSKFPRDSNNFDSRTFLLSSLSYSYYLAYQGSFFPSTGFLQVCEKCIAETHIKVLALINKYRLSQNPQPLGKVMIKSVIGRINFATCLLIVTY